MEFRQELFWDTNPEKIDTEKNALYIIERILDFGNAKEVAWVRRFYDKSIIKQVVENPRRLMPETKTLWNLILQNS